MTERVGREDEFAPVAREFARVRRVHNPGVEDDAVEAGAVEQAAPHARGRGAHGSGVRDVEQKRLDGRARNARLEGVVGGGEPVGVAAAHDHVGAGLRELLAREVAEPGVRARDQIRPPVLGRQMRRIPRPARARAHGSEPILVYRRAAQARWAYSGQMPELFLVVMGLTCVAVIVMAVRALRRMKNGRDDDDAFGPRR